MSEASNHGNIRPCTAADLPAVRALLNQTWHATYDSWLGADKVCEITEIWHCLPQLAAQVDRPGSLFLLAERAGRIVGTAFAHKSGDGTVEIGRLYVLPLHQQLGFGAALLAAIVAGFPATAHFQLDVEPRNAQAIAFYQHHGFRIVAAGSNCGGHVSGIPHLRMQWMRHATAARLA